MTLHRRARAIIRHFPENGLKLLLENAANVRDLLALHGGEVVADLLDLIDFARLARVPVTFVARDFRHVEADVVLRAPVRQRGTRSRTTVRVYVLIEHQSEPDRLMPLRLVDYVTQIFKAQLRDWSRRHRSFAGSQAQPVVPVVFYTGTQRWETPGRLIDLMALGEHFARLTPDLESLFLNLGALPAARLETEGGFFGRVLRVVQRRRARPEDYRQLVQALVEHLETMPAAERLRWLELLSYLHALVYHDRDPAEAARLQEVIEASVRTEQHRREVAAMGKSMADVLREEGRKEGKKQEAVRSRKETLLRLLRRRFGEPPTDVSAAVEACKSVSQLDDWLDRFATAAKLEDVGIPATQRRQGLTGPGPAGR
jgi:ElaB/YqjD/DUF883 family membrane-anchored ribosome-binding protein